MSRKEGERMAIYVAGALLLMGLMSLIYLNRERKEIANIESRVATYTKTTRVWYREERKEK
jgi:hypothetical protein